MRAALVALALVGPLAPAGVTAAQRARIDGAALQPDSSDRCSGHLIVGGRGY